MNQKWDAKRAAGNPEIGQAVMRYRKKFRPPTQKPVAHCRGRISGAITDVANVTMVDRTGQAKSWFVFHRWRAACRRARRTGPRSDTHLFAVEGA
jgi:hypothetical protein